MATPDRAAQVDAFIEAELTSFAQFLKAQARAAIIRRRIRVDDTLLNSLATEAARNALEFSFSPAGRFHDMGAGRAYHKGVYTGNRKDVSLLKGRKPSKWYSRLAYGAVYGTLANNLANKFIEVTVAGLKADITAQ